MLLSFVPALRELTTHGSRSFRNALLRIEARASGAKCSRARREVLASEAWQDVMRETAVLEFAGAHFLHPKLHKLVEVGGY